MTNRRSRTNPWWTHEWLNHYRYHIGHVPYNGTGSVEFKAKLKPDLVQGFTITNTGYLWSLSAQETNTWNNLAVVNNALSGGMIWKLKILKYIQWLRNNALFWDWADQVMQRWSANPYIIEYDNQSNTDFYNQIFKELGQWKMGDVPMGSKVTKTLNIIPFTDKKWFWKVVD